MKIRITAEVERPGGPTIVRNDRANLRVACAVIAPSWLSHPAEAGAVIVPERGRRRRADTTSRLATRELRYRTCRDLDLGHKADLARRLPTRLPSREADMGCRIIPIICAAFDRG